jgi:hypothetical protein
MSDWLFHDETDDWEPAEPGEMERCTPERLLAFYNQTVAETGKPPDLRDIKRKFGGILGPLIDSFTLVDQGLIKPLRRPRKWKKR